ncbi:MAG: hypothetical protein WAM39_08565, partial [Bryobacteraceae bacterium]
PSSDHRGRRCDQERVGIPGGASGAWRARGVADLGHAPQIQAPERFHKVLLEGCQSLTAVL